MFQHKKSRANLINFTCTADRKTDALYMKEVDNFISGWNIFPWGYID